MTKGERPHNGLLVGSLDGLEKFGEGLDLDAGIRFYVLILRSQGIETCQSCEGGPNHSYAEPTVDFLGGKGEGPRAVAAALTYGLPMAELRRVWHLRDSEMEGPIWSMTFYRKADDHERWTAANEAAWFETKTTGRILARP